jgi:NADH dehydrogenase FAD-containing subunit
MVSAVDYLDRILDPVAETLTPTSAERLTRLVVDPAVQDRIDELAEKCNEGELTPEEREEYDMYVYATGMVAILQAKARAVLARQSHG